MEPYLVQKFHYIPKYIHIYLEHLLPRVGQIMIKVGYQRDRLSLLEIKIFTQISKRYKMKHSRKHLIYLFKIIHQ